MTSARRTASRTLWLVRHGLPTYRDGKRPDEPPGPPLSDVGRLQAVQAAQALRECAAEAIYCSPLARTIQTAERIRAVLVVPLEVAGDLSEWHRTESLFEVNQRSARWLVRWLAGPQRRAVVVGHASPLLSILRSALYLPHLGWYVAGKPHVLQLSSCDRFEVSMGSVFRLDVTSQTVTAALVFHPDPRVLHAQFGPVCRTAPRPVVGHGENTFMERPNFLHLLGAQRG